MSNLSIANLPRITPATLKSYMLNPATAPSFVIVDVRDSDHVGGHLPGSLHHPTNTHATALPELARTLQDKQLVIFHCMICQARGPKSALEYARTRERLLGAEKGRALSNEEVALRASGMDVQGSGVDAGKAAEKGTRVFGLGRGQCVAILEGGFQAWQQAGYGEDERLTEGYNKNLWEGDWAGGFA